MHQALLSVATQTYPYLEIVLVLDNPDDETVAVAEKFAKVHDRCRLVRVDSEGDFGCTARNIGLENASGSYVCYLDEDDLMLPHAVAQRVAYAKHHDAGIVLTDFKVIYGRLEQVTAAFPIINHCTSGTIFHHHLLPGLWGNWNSKWRAHDGEMVERWVSKGSSYVCVHHVDLIKRMDSKRYPMKFQMEGHGGYSCPETDRWRASKEA